MKAEPILHPLRADDLAPLLSRRDAIAKGASASAGVAAALKLGSVPVALAALARDVHGQTTGPTLTSILNFALALEILERDFYTRGIGTTGPTLTATDRTVFTQIQAHEADHVTFLQAALGTAAVTAYTFDFTGGGAYPDVFTNAATFRAVAQAFEDLGVRAYKGQAPNLLAADTAAGKPTLTAALRIHSVEARHAARVRQLRGQSPTVPATDTSVPGPAGTGATSVYAAGAAGFPAEDNTAQGTATIVGTSGLTAAVVARAFDEPLDRAAVVARANLFIVSPKLAAA